jgi:hypothetical protein
MMMIDVKMMMSASKVRTKKVSEDEVPIERS